MATSACVAAIAGATAPIAVTPHTLVPQAIRDPKRGGSPAYDATVGMVAIPTVTAAAAAGMVVQPKANTYVLLSWEVTRRWLIKGGMKNGGGEFLFVHDEQQKELNHRKHSHLSCRELGTDTDHADTQHSRCTH